MNASIALVVIPVRIERGRPIVEPSIYISWITLAGRVRVAHDHHQIVGNICHHGLAFGFRAGSYGQCETM